MKESTFSYTDDMFDVRVTVTQASRALGIKKAAIADGAMQSLGEPDVLSPIETLIIRFTGSAIYPSCAAATTNIENGDAAVQKLKLPMTYREFLDLPDKLVEMWEQAVFALNPHWVPFSEQGEKKEPRRTEDTSESA
jgi:hypothetical protein